MRCVYIQSSNRYVYFDVCSVFRGAHDVQYSCEEGRKGRKRGGKDSLDSRQADRQSKGRVALSRNSITDI